MIFRLLQFRLNSMADIKVDTSSLLRRDDNGNKFASSQGQ